MTITTGGTSSQSWTLNQTDPFSSEDNNSTPDEVFNHSGTTEEATKEASFNKTLVAENLDGTTVLSILLTNPEEIELLEKPSAIRTDKVFTLNTNNVSIKSMKIEGR